MISIYLIRLLIMKRLEFELSYSIIMTYNINEPSDKHYHDKAFTT